MSLADHALRAALVGMSLPPLSLSRAVGRSLGRLAHRLDDRHRAIIRDNLAASFPDNDEAWVQATALQVYEHIGQVAAEIPRLARLDPARLLERTRLAQPDRMDRLREQLHAGRGAFVLTGHIGNWEWLNLALGQYLGKSAVIARPIDWPPADRLVNGWRARAGGEVLPKAGSARRVLGALKGGKAVGILLDQNVDWYDGEWVDFFGRPACTNKGLALLAMKTKLPVRAAWCWRDDDGGFSLHLGPELPVIRSGDKTQDVWDNTQLYTKALEEIIRQRPAQWFWLHQRWKTKPFHNWPQERK